jgi:hypothetical protein
MPPLLDVGANLAARPVSHTVENIHESHKVPLYIVFENQRMDCGKVQATSNCRSGAPEPALLGCHVSRGVVGRDYGIGRLPGPLCRPLLRLQLSIWPMPRRRRQTPKG